LPVHPLREFGCPCTAGNNSGHSRIASSTSAHTRNGRAACNESCTKSMLHRSLGRVGVGAETGLAAAHFRRRGWPTSKRSSRRRRSMRLYCTRVPSRRRRHVRRGLPKRGLSPTSFLDRAASACESGRRLRDRTVTRDALTHADRALRALRAAILGGCAALSGRHHFPPTRPSTPAH
jgi:hypothetical protein